MLTHSFKTPLLSKECLYLNLSEKLKHKETAGNDVGDHLPRAVLQFKEVMLHLRRPPDKSPVVVWGCSRSWREEEYRKTFFIWEVGTQVFLNFFFKWHIYFCLLDIFPNKNTTAKVPVVIFSLPWYPIFRY